MNVLSVVAANATLIALVFLLFTALGWLWFQPGSPVGLSSKDRVLSRLALYPILGWMLTMVGVNWLRVLALPFLVTTPWLLGGLLALPGGFWLWRMFRGNPVWSGSSILWSHRRTVGLFFGLVFFFALIPVNRLTVPSLYDAGVWGYDQTNYVHIADQYLDKGMFEPSDTPSGGILAPWVAFNQAIFRSFISAHPFQALPFSSNPSLGSLTRGLSLIMRNGGAGMDAFIASWLRLDGLQAYVLDGYIQYLFLVLAGIWVGLQFQIRRWGCILLGAVAGLWPIAVFPSLLDNRDQALALVIILILLGSTFFGSLNVWIRGLTLGALALTYIEILPIAMVAWTALHFDGRRPYREIVARWIATGMVALGCCLVFVPWGTQFMGLQLTNSQTMKMGAIIGVQFGAMSNFAGSFSGIGAGSSAIFVIMAAVAGGAMLGLQLTGLALWGQQRRYFGIAGFFILATVAVIFQQKGLTYASYKMCTVLFPLAVLLYSENCRFVDERMFGAKNADRKRIFPIGVLLLIVLSLPALGLGAAMRSGFGFKNLQMAQGQNSLLEDRAHLTLDHGLRVRSTDITLAREISEQLSTGQGVAVSNFSRFDDAYFGHFLRQRPVAILNDFGYNQYDPASGSLFSPDHHFLTAGEPISRVIALCGPPDDSVPASPAKDIAIVRGQVNQAYAGRTFVSYSISPSQEFAFVQRIFSQIPLKGLSGGFPNSGFTFGGGGIALGVYVVNSKVQSRTLSFDVLPGPSVKMAWFQSRALTWKCMVDGQPGEWSMAPMEAGFRVKISMPASPAGNMVEFGPKDRLPIDPNVVYRTRPERIQKPGAVNEMENFAIEDIPK